VFVGHVGDREAVLQHRKDDAIALFHDAQLHKHPRLLLGAQPTAEPKVRRGGGVKKDPEPAPHGVKDVPELRCRPLTGTTHIPGLKQAPGFVSALFLSAPTGSEGLGIVTFNTQEDANTARDNFRTPPGVTPISVEVHEIARAT